ncbi:hypothetical protein GIB67_018254 [Kingdonia uniflora]|uniref:Germin-like protein n=1 Tax=Kingdonia uniflora TaxID=39325 RepID=A0A7J7LF76_9MAGN|nr:hypothetical protein GIB67_018254 [Kingdonia uniflora]
MAFKHGILVLVVVVFAVVHMVTAGDPNIVTDFVVPSNVTQVDVNHFAYTGLRALVGVDIPPAFKVLKVSMAEFSGFVDVDKKFYTQKLQAGDVFVFPKGLVHYQYNTDAQNFAVAASVFGSASTGTVSLPSTMFTTGIDDTVLAKSFKTDVATVQSRTCNQSLTYKASLLLNINVLIMNFILDGNYAGIDEGILEFAFKTDAAIIEKIKAGLAS